MRYELADDGWAAIKPMLPNKPRGVPRVNDRHVLNGIFWTLRSGAPWPDLPDNLGPYTTCYNRLVRCDALTQSSNLKMFEGSTAYPARTRCSTSARAASTTARGR
jgi:transposase